MAEYSSLDKLQHRLALQFLPLAELSFDIDQKLVRQDLAQTEDERHVFVSGLARAGTTILMRQFHETGLYRSLTYRDMPFVLAPNLWRKLSNGSTAHSQATERAHGDNILVSADSPESLDEVFWRIFTGSEYIRSDRLVPHQPDTEEQKRFVRYVNAILNAQDEPVHRYLSKNNNNILRLPAIRQAFPNALILIPFRDPASHASSLLRQHSNFKKLQAADPFVRSYMTWLAHHEFGLDHRPFDFTDTFAPDTSSDTIDYWLELWCSTYNWLADQAPSDAFFVCYEDLCSNPENWCRLAAIADIPADKTKSPLFKKSNATIADVSANPVAARAASIYLTLRDRANRSIAN